MKICDAFILVCENTNVNTVLFLKEQINRIINSSLKKLNITVIVNKKTKKEDICFEKEMKNLLNENKVKCIYIDLMNDNVTKIFKQNADFLVSFPGFQSNKSKSVKSRRKVSLEDLSFDVKLSMSPQ